MLRFVARWDGAEAVVTTLRQALAAATRTFAAFNLPGTAHWPDRTPSDDASHSQPRTAAARRLAARLGQ